ncbi:two-component system regulatory protein YycI [Solibacillus sp. CAU 1738]|uniref:two-component system regulatory protein YycI n=1 Tax=Solibacillus sp. CAU 1738 TaxID=3140363 RepID=UPI0032619977
MDWSKTKSIFIFVFLILNIFLYLQYLNNYNEAQKVEEPGEKDIEVRLKEDNITYDALPTNIETATYITGKVKNFNIDELPVSAKQSYNIESDNNTLVVTLREPIKLRSIDEVESFQEFLQQYVYEGSSYKVWNIDADEGSAICFQRMNDSTLYNGFVKVYFNEDGEVYKYEQKMLENLEELNRKKNIFTPIQIIQSLYAKNLLKPDSHITSMELGYSTLVQLTQTQVFAPTWEVRVETADGMNEQFFVNAVEGKVIDMQLDVKDVEEEE